MRPVTVAVTVRRRRVTYTHAGRAHLHVGLYISLSVGCILLLLLLCFNHGWRWTRRRRVHERRDFAARYLRVCVRPLLPMVNYHFHFDSRYGAGHFHVLITAQGVFVQRVITAVLTEHLHHMIAFITIRAPVISHRVEVRRAVR